MTPDRLVELLKTTEPPDRRRTAACPDEQALAAYVDGTLGPNDRPALERHLADCSHCLGLVGFLSRERSTTEFAPVSTATLSRAAHDPTPPLHRTRHVLPYLSAAAALFLAIAVLVNVTQLTGNTREAPDEGVRAVRKTVPATAAPELLQPRPGTALPGRQLVFRWTAVPGSRYYDVRILNDAGDVIVDQRVHGTSWQSPTPLALQPGTDYYVHVDAYLADDRAVGSDHVPFRVVP